MVCAWIARKIVGGSAVAHDGKPGAPQPPLRPALTYRHPERAVALGLWFARLVAALLAVWAVAAGTWRAQRPGAVHDDALRTIDPDWLVLAGGAVFYAAGALGAVALVLLAAALVGGAFGFLFGLPRMEGRVAVTQGAASEAAVRSGGPAGGGAPAASTPVRTTTEASTAAERTTFRMSPALNEIADWLTKIIVGLGLVQAREIGDGFLAIVTWLLGPVGLSRFPMAGAVVPASIVIGLIGGFVLVYLVMTLVIGRELADAALDLDAERARQLEAEERRGLEARAKLEAQRAVVRAWGTREMTRRLDALRPGAERPPVDAEAQAFAAQDLSTVADSEVRAWYNVQRALGNDADAERALPRLNPV
jgi:hypothetical protein